MKEITGTITVERALAAAHQTRATTVRIEYVDVLVAEVERLSSIEINVRGAATRFLNPATAYAEGWANAAHYALHGEPPDDAEYGGA